MTKAARGFDTQLPLQQSSGMGALFCSWGKRVLGVWPTCFLWESWEGAVASPHSCSPHSARGRTTISFWASCSVFNNCVLYFICVNSVCAHVHAHTRVETANTLSMLEGVFVSALLTDQASKRMPVTWARCWSRWARNSARQLPIGTLPHLIPPRPEGRPPSDLKTGRQK